MSSVEIWDIIDFIDEALIEDIQEGDHTTLATIDHQAAGTAKLLVKEPGIIAGVELAEQILRHVNPELEVDIFIPDGARVEPGDVVFHATGRVQALLVAERTMLNFMQRMSGIATTTNLFVQTVRHTGAKILDTRKTTPGLRTFEKWAVRIGGGHNHRYGLYDMILIKDNHIDFCGGITPAILKVKEYLRDNDLNLRIEVETRNLEEVAEVLRTGHVDRIMFDNFDVDTMRQAVIEVAGQFETEASGGVNLTTVQAIAETGVNFISVGALTHSVKSLDLSFKALIH
ncbi:MAG TPA: carboxylating nicotinate-nucleotide diphosphorylase [Chitinophagales bacterium]|nr:carboxylating nicotinate-nucleotide diphosphorylase [Chitinophagales bacterium]HMZ88419.1 carboxylating nicotinate-nucleotide diphosphorylase [Chitinophagales bacterium]HNA56923.1 carboxylating nicotinate-nucleotide diphosphorylase [Chitinophagales bacterium]HNE45673.1 carboxylating nicotinate-nucleotide diphosphorylase [Chitinophagales bacterium]HNF68004.1 carboxylating nicotinate-nucleotide diphosphorylase [Chitinophagales bacterium]